MKIRVLAVGKTEKGPSGELLNEYLKRIQRYHPLVWEELPDLKTSSSLSVEEQKIKEGKLILGKLSDKDKVYLLDENGSEFSSKTFSTFLAKLLGSGSGSLTFIIGGAFGFSADVYKRADGKISLSKMTFSHQLIRGLFAEQLYRSFTILRNEKYHHD